MAKIPNAVIQSKISAVNVAQNDGAGLNPNIIQDAEYVSVKAVLLIIPKRHGLSGG